MSGTELAYPTSLKWEAKGVRLLGRVMTKPLPEKPNERSPGGFSECSTLFSEMAFSRRNTMLWWSKQQHTIYTQ